MSINPAALAITMALNAASMAMTASRTIEGPRLKDLSATTADYGTPLNYFYGRRRLTCPCFFAEPIKEVKKKRKTKGGKYKEYTYYGTFAIAIADHAIGEVTRVWADKHLVYDQTKAGARSVFADVVGSKIGGAGANSVRIYTGTETQEPDPRILATIEAAEGADTAPAYRGVAYLVFEDLPLEKFGNRFPQISVEAVNGTVSHGIDLDATVLTASNDAANLVLNPYTREFVRISNFGEFGDMWTASADSLAFIRTAGNASAAAAASDWYFRTYAQIQAGNSAELGANDTRTGERIFVIGERTNGLTDALDRSDPLPAANGSVWFLNFGNWTAMTDINTGYSWVMHWSTPNFEAFSLIWVDGIPAGTHINGTLPESITDCILAATSTPSQMPGGTAQFSAVIPDHDRACFWCIMRAASTFDIYKIQPGTSAYTETLAGQISRNGAGATFPGNTDISGWAVNRKTGDLLLSDGSVIIRYNPDDDNIEASSSSLPSWGSDYNWWAGDFFAYASGTTATVIRTDDLSVIQSVTTSELDGIRAITFDDQTLSLLYTTRVTGLDDKIKRLSLNILSASGYPLADIIDDVSTRCGIDAAYLDTDDLTDTVPGWSWTQGDGKAILEPLLEIYDTDARPHDFKMQFLPRGS